MADKLKRGVANKIRIVLKTAAGTPATGATVTFAVVEARHPNPEEAPKLGEDTFPAPETATAGTYEGTFPKSASMEILVQPSREYRVVPFVEVDDEEVFVGDDQTFTVEFA